MKILVVAATWNEIKPLEQYLLKKDEEKYFREHAIELLVTGAGSVFTAFHLARLLPLDNWDLAINAGVCGSFDKDLTPGAVVNVTSDCFADLGAEDNQVFLDSFELGLMDKNAFPFRDGTITPLNEQGTNALKPLRKVAGITVNTVSGKASTIAMRRERYGADVESMEGAAFMYCCMKQSVPCLQLRAVSNYIEKRNKSKWNMGLAIENLNGCTIQLIEELLAPKEQ